MNKQNRLALKVKVPASACQDPHELAVDARRKAILHHYKLPSTPQQLLRYLQRNSATFRLISLASTLHITFRFTVKVSAADIYQHASSTARAQEGKFARCTQTCRMANQPSTSKSASSCSSTEAEKLWVSYEDTM